MNSESLHSIPKNYRQKYYFVYNHRKFHALTRTRHPSGEWSHRPADATQPVEYNLTIAPNSTRIPPVFLPPSPSEE